MLTRKPVKGDRVRWPDWAPGRTALVTAPPDGNLCWIKEDDWMQAEPFIWRNGGTGALNPLAEIVEQPCLELFASQEAE